MSSVRGSHCEPSRASRHGHGRDCTNAPTVGPRLTGEQIRKLRGTHASRVHAALQTRPSSNIAFGNGRVIERMTRRQGGTGRRKWMSTRPGRCQAGVHSGCDPEDDCCMLEPASPPSLTGGFGSHRLEAGFEAAGDSWRMQVEGGAWQRLLYFGVMKIHPALHAVAKSGLVRVDGAMERRLSALAAWRLP